MTKQKVRMMLKMFRKNEFEPSIADGLEIDRDEFEIAKEAYKAQEEKIRYIASDQRIPKILYEYLIKEKNMQDKEIAEIFDVTQKRILDVRNELYMNELINKYLKQPRSSSWMLSRKQKRTCGSGCVFDDKSKTFWRAS